MRARAFVADQIGGELRAHELVVRHVVVERLDHPVAIQIRVRDTGCSRGPSDRASDSRPRRSARRRATGGPTFRRSAATPAGDRRPSRTRRATSSFWNASISSAVGGRPVRSSVARRISVRLSAARTGARPSCSRRASTKRSMSVFGHSPCDTAGTGRLVNRLERPERALLRRDRRSRLAVGDCRAAVADAASSRRRARSRRRLHPLDERVDFVRLEPSALRHLQRRRSAGRPESAGSCRDRRARSPGRTCRPSASPRASRAAARRTARRRGSRSNWRRAPAAPRFEEFGGERPAAAPCWACCEPAQAAEASDARSAPARPTLRRNHSCTRLLCTIAMYKTRDMVPVLRCCVDGRTRCSAQTPTPRRGPASRRRA